VDFATVYRCWQLRVGREVAVKVDNRVLHELYLLPYEMSVKDGGVASIMCSYNREGGVYSCDNPYTLTEVLRNQWGFEGYVQSDFGATHSTAVSLNAGEDFEMQSGNFYSATRINAALADGSLQQATIDRALKRRYVQMFKFGVFDRPITHTPLDAATAQAHGAVARSIGEQIAVLLKNQGAMLPLGPPETFGAHVAAETERWGALIRRAGIRME